MMNEWLELIERNEEQIINTGIEAYKEAIENTQLRYIVELNTNVTPKAISLICGMS